MMSETATTDEMPAEAHGDTKLPEWLVTEAPFEIPEEPRRRPYVGIGAAFLVSVLLWAIIIAALFWLF